jgi:hypothetical protein
VGAAERDIPVGMRTDFVQNFTLIPERFTTVNLEGFYGTYGLKAFNGSHVTSLRLPIGSRVGKKVFIGPRVGVLEDQIAFVVFGY